MGLKTEKRHKEENKTKEKQVKNKINISISVNTLFKSILYIFPSEAIKYGRFF